MRLTGLANFHGTDKGSVRGDSHGYTLLYDALFGARRQEQLDLLEIGLCIGGPELPGGSANREVAAAPSLAMWHFYFPKAHIHGVDISDFSRFESDWFTFHRADCSDEEALGRVAATLPRLDIVVDDGSHASFHQQLAFLAFFPRLKPGGLYLIEDLHWQPDHYQRGLPQVPPTHRLLGGFVESGCFSETGAIAEEKWASLAASLGVVLLFDQGWFDAHRRQFNRRMKAEPQRPDDPARAERIKLALVQKL